MRRLMKAMREVVVAETVTCDRCDSSVPDRPYCGSFTEVEITFREGSTSPSGGGGTVAELDVCPECAPKLKELIEAAGFKFHTTEWDT